MILFLIESDSFFLYYFALCQFPIKSTSVNRWKYRLIEIDTSQTNFSFSISKSFAGNLLFLKRIFGHGLIKHYDCNWRNHDIIRITDKYTCSLCKTEKRIMIQLWCSFTCKILENKESLLHCITVIFSSIIWNIIILFIYLLQSLQTRKIIFMVSSTLKTISSIIHLIRIVVIVLEKYFQKILVENQLVHTFQ